MLSVPVYMVIYVLLYIGRTLLEEVEEDTSGCGAISGIVSIQNEFVPKRFNFCLSTS